MKHTLYKSTNLKDNMSLSIDEVLKTSYIYAQGIIDWNNILDILVKECYINSTDKVCLKACFHAMKTPGEPKFLYVPEKTIYTKNTINNGYIKMDLCDLKELFKSKQKNETVMNIKLGEETFKKLNTLTLRSPIGIRSWEPVFIVSYACGLITKNTFDDLLTYLRTNSTILDRNTHYWRVGSASFDFNSADTSVSGPDFFEIITKEIRGINETSEGIKKTDDPFDVDLDNPYDTEELSTKEETKEDYSTATHLLVKIISASTTTKLEEKLNKFFKDTSGKIKVVDMKHATATTMSIFYHNYEYNEYND